MVSVQNVFPIAIIVRKQQHVRIAKLDIISTLKVNVRDVMKNVKHAKDQAITVLLVLLSISWFLENACLARSISRTVNRANKLTICLYVCNVNQLTI